MRGPDGAMVTAVDGMYNMRRDVFLLFNAGMFSVLFMGIFGAWILFDALAAGAMTLVLGAGIWAIVSNQGRIVALFDFAEADAVRFDDIFRVVRNIRIQPPA
jgi:hypothetical protein